MKRALGRSKGHSVGRKITEIRREDERPSEILSQNNRTGIGKIHLGRPPFDKIENRR